jgi:uroporphyrinogen-III synthase
LPPLIGLRIVVTRAAHQAEELANPLRALGADVLLVPVIEIAPPADLGPLRRAAANCNQYDWIILTSNNAVAAFVPRLQCPAHECRARVATVGAATRHAAEQYGLKVSITPRTYVAESLLEAFADEDLNGRRILIPSAAVTRDLIVPELRRRGAQVDVVEAYRNVIPTDAADRARAVLRAPYPEWVTFASSSAVDNLVSLVGTAALVHTRIASIGPITSNTIRSHGLTVTTEAAPHTLEGLVEAVASFKTSP